MRSKDKAQYTNLLSLAPAPLAKVMGKPYYDLDGAVDGFELQNRPMI